MTCLGSPSKRFRIAMAAARIVGRRLTSRTSPAPRGGGPAPPPGGRGAARTGAAAGRLAPPPPPFAGGGEGGGGAYLGHAPRGGPGGLQGLEGWVAVPRPRSGDPVGARRD